MDLNYLFLRQQVERVRADAAADDRARRSHEELARAYETSIEQESGGRIMFPRQEERDDDPETMQAISAPPTPSASS